MLKLASEADSEKLNKFCNKNVFGTYICCRAKAYGFSSDFSRLWISKDKNENILCAVSSLDGNAVILSADGCDFEELSTAIRIFGFSSVLTDAHTAKKVLSDSFSQKTVMKFIGTCKDIETSGEADMRSIYRLLISCFPESYSESKNEYLSWLFDFMHRKKLELANIESVVSECAVIAVAMTAAESENSAVISSVACAKKYRNSGYGKAVVLSLASKLKSKGKDVFAIAKNDDVISFYRKIGFTECGFAAYIERF